MDHKFFYFVLNCIPSHPQEIEARSCIFPSKTSYTYDILKAKYSSVNIYSFSNHQTVQYADEKEIERRDVSCFSSGTQSVPLVNQNHWGHTVHGIMKDSNQCPWLLQKKKCRKPFMWPPNILTTDQGHSEEVQVGVHLFTATYSGQIHTQITCLLES